MRGCRLLFRACAVALVLCCAAARADDPFKPLAGTWRFSEGPEFPGAKGALEPVGGGVRLQYDFSGGGNYAAAHLDFPEPLPLTALSFRAALPEEARLTLRVEDCTGQCLQKGLADAGGDGPVRVVKTALGDWSGHWGGANDGVPHPPLRNIAILIESDMLDKPAGAVVITSVKGAVGPVPGLGTHAGRYLATDFGDGSGFSASGGTLEKGLWTMDGGGALSHSLSLFGKPKKIELELRDATPGLTLTLSLGSHFQTFTRTLGVTTGGPQTFALDQMPPEGWDHSGAEEDNISYPLRVCRIAAESPNGAARVEFGGLYCATEMPDDKAVVLFSTLNAGEGSARALMSCRGWNLLDAPVAGTLRRILRDWDGRVLAEDAQAWTLPAGGTPVDMPWEQPIPGDRNFVDAEFRFESEGRAPVSARSGFTRPMPDGGDAALAPESLWGMGVYLYRYPHPKNDPSGQMARAAELARAAGVKWTREEFSWAGIETAPGQYDFGFYDAVVDTARKNGISVYGLLSYWGRFTEPYTEKGVDDFCLWARATVRHFKDRVKHWEIYNEPNIFFWTGPKELYPVLVKKCYAAIREEDPEAAVLAVSTAGIDRPFIKMVVDAGAPFDALTVHPYRSRLDDAKLIRELQAASAAADGRPVWITEMGWSTHIGPNANADERSQALLLARSYLSGAASGVVRNMGWYDFRDDGGDPFYFEYNFGVVRQDFTPKPAYRALATVCRLMAGGPPGAVRVSGGGVLALRAGGTLALWSPGKSREAALVFKKKPAALCNLMGEALPDAPAKRMRLTLPKDSPVFITGGGVRSVRAAK